MKKGITRRQFVGASAGIGCAATLLAPSAVLGPAKADEIDKPALRIGLMTYRLGQDWDVATIIKNCQEAQWEHAELQTTHAHGVEVGFQSENDSCRPCRGRATSLLTSAR